MNKALDITGQKFNMLTALEKTEKRKNGLVIWKFKCDCGNIVEIPAAMVKAGNNKSCGCQKNIGLVKYNQQNKTIKVNDTFGKLTVIEDLGYQLYSNQRKRTKFLCKCECGNITEAWSHQLASGTKVSCGCITSKGEMIIRNLLIKNNIIFKQDFALPELYEYCNRKLRFDFVIYDDNKNINRIIEFDGRQHYDGPDTRIWGRTSDTLESIIERDNIKNNFCKEKGYILLRIPYYNLKYLKFEDLMGDKFITKGDD